jgi:hypothetical protein
VFLLGGRVDIANLLDVLNLPHCFTSILIVGVFVARTYVAAVLRRAVSDLDVAIPVRALMVYICYSS